LVVFFIGKYCDEVLYDVMPIQVSHVLFGRLWQYDMRVIHDGVTNKYFFEMNEKLITLVSLTPKQIYEEQLKLNKEKMVENEACISGGTFFTNKVFLDFVDDDVILRFDINLLTLEDVFHDSDSMNLFKEGDDDTNQLRSRFGLKISAD